MNTCASFLDFSWSEFTFRSICVLLMMGSSSVFSSLWVNTDIALILCGLIALVWKAYNTNLLTKMSFQDSEKQETPDLNVLKLVVNHFAGKQRAQVTSRAVAELEQLDFNQDHSKYQGSYLIVLNIVNLSSQKNWERPATWFSVISCLLWVEVYIFHVSSYMNPFSLNNC